MGEQQCPKCGASTGQDGTATCECVLTAAREVDAVFDAFQPLPASSPPSFPADGKRPEGAAEQDLADAERHRAGRRRVVIVAAGLVALGLGTAVYLAGISAGDVKSSGEAALHPSAGPSASAVETQRPDQPAASPDRSETESSPSASGKPTPPKESDEKDKPTRPPTDDGSVLVGEPILVEGDTGPEVAELQRRLKVRPANGNFDNTLTRAIFDFQRENSVDGDAPGTYGPNTRRALGL
jgi:hypothetical protein